jgi:Fe2+ transport system protein B
MIDQLEKRKSYIDRAGLEMALGVPVVGISALRSRGTDELMKEPSRLPGKKGPGTPYYGIHSLTMQ